MGGTLRLAQPGSSRHTTSSHARLLRISCASRAAGPPCEARRGSPRPPARRHLLGSLGCQNRAAVEGIEEDAAAGNTRADDEVTRQAHALDLHAHASADLYGENRQRDGNPESPIEHVVEAGVARIVVLLVVAAKALLEEQEGHELVERGLRTA